MMTGDWTCVQCGYHNFARNEHCRGCGAGKDGSPGDGYGKAGKGDGSSEGPYGKGFGKGKKGKSGLPATTIEGLIDALIKEGLPGGHFDHNKHALYVTNLPQDTTEHDLYIMFACFGAIPPRGVRVMPSQEGSRRYGFVTFMEGANSEFAMMAMNGVTQPDGMKLIVKVKGDKSWKEGKDKGKGMEAITAGNMASPGGPSPNIDPLMVQRLQGKLLTGMMSSYDISQWYIIQFLGHITDENDMKASCDMLLEACSYLGLA